MKDSIKLTGRVELTLLDGDGKIIDSRAVNNLVVNVGKSLIAARIANSGTAPTHIAIGTNSTIAQLVQTSLIAELTRVACGSVSSSGAVATFTTTFGAGVGTGNIQEAGLFNAGAAGTMAARVTFGNIPKGAPDSLIINWYLTVN